MWFVFALLSAVFAALTSVLAKVGIEGVNSNLATALRTCVVLAMAWLMVFITHTQSGIGSIGRKSWLCYYKAIQMGSVSKVAPIDKLSVVITLILAVIFLHEDFTVRSAIGAVLITAGTVLMVL